MKTIPTLLAAGLLLVATAAAAGTPPARMQDGMLVGGNGMSLYTFDKDEAGSGKSVCNGKCAENWPPLTVADTEASAGDFSVIGRDDGRKQWAYKGKPLYFWVKDLKPGDTSGDGVNKVWRLAR